MTWKPGYQLEVKSDQLMAKIMCEGREDDDDICNDQDNKSLYSLQCTVVKAKTFFAKLNFYFKFKCFGTWKQFQNSWIVDLFLQFKMLQPFWLNCDHCAQYLSTFTLRAWQWSHDALMWLSSFNAWFGFENCIPLVHFLRVHILFMQQKMARKIRRNKKSDTKDNNAWYFFILRD